MTDDLIERLNKFMGEYGDAKDECISQAVDALAAAQARIAELETKVAGWRPVDSAPYETPVLTFWPGSEKRSPKICVNTRNNGLNLGKKDTWWNSKPDEQPIRWMPLPLPLPPGEQPDAAQEAARVRDALEGLLDAHEAIYPSVAEKKAALKKLEAGILRALSKAEKVAK